MLSHALRRFGLICFRVSVSCGDAFRGVAVLQDFKVLTFDVVGTLIDFERGMLDYLHAVAPATAVGDSDFLTEYRAARKSADSSWYPDDLVRSGTPSRRRSACPTAPRSHAASATRSATGPHLRIQPKRCSGCAVAIGWSR